MFLQKSRLLSIIILLFFIRSFCKANPESDKKFILELSSNIGIASYLNFNPMIGNICGIPFTFDFSKDDEIHKLINSIKDKIDLSCDEKIIKVTIYVNVNYTTDTSLLLQNYFDDENLIKIICENINSKKFFISEWKELLSMRSNYFPDILLISNNDESLKKPLIIVCLMYTNKRNLKVTIIKSKNELSFSIKSEQGL